MLKLSAIFTFTSSNSLKKGGATSDLTKINIRSLQSINLSALFE